MTKLRIFILNNKKSNYTVIILPVKCIELNNKKKYSCALNSLRKFLVLFIFQK